MHLMYTIDASGKRAYTLQKTAEGRVTKSAHPARFSPDDKWSRYRLIMRKRYGVLIAQHLEGQKLPAPAVDVRTDVSMDA